MYGTMNLGRKILYTDVAEVTNDNIIDVIRKVQSDFDINVSDMNFLLNYDKGDQPLLRVKKYRPEIDIECIDNIANEITEFKLSYNWQSPITIGQRGRNDSGNSEEPLAISLLNECYEVENIKTKTQELARFVEITGVGYSYVDINTEYSDGDSYFTVDILDPRNTFVVRSTHYLDKRVILAVTFTNDLNGNRHYTCFTKDIRFEIDCNGGAYMFGERNAERNPLGTIPIIEWIRSYDRMGCFERQLPEMDNLNLLASDFSNDVDQNCQAVWVGIDFDFEEDENGNLITPRSNEWVIARSTEEGKKPDVKALTIPYDYPGMLSNIVTRRQLILQKCNVPQRNDNNSGGSTGIAMSDATGWSNAEAAACKQQNLMESCKMEELKVVLRAIKKSSHIERENPLLNLRYTDCQPNIKRQKTYELTTKVNFFATAVSHGINGLHALKAMNAFEDVNQVWEDSRETIEMYQQSVITKGEAEDRLEGDNSDQISNSPNLKG